MKSPQQIISELQATTQGVKERSSTANLLKAITKDAKEFFIGVGQDITSRISKNKFDVEVKNFPKPVEVQKIEGQVSLKNARDYIIGLNEIKKTIETTIKSLEMTTKSLNKDLKPEKIDLTPVVEAIDAIEIPETVIPEFPKEMSVSNFKELKKSFDDLAKKFDIKPPVVNVPSFPNKIEVSNFPEPEKIDIPAPIVNVDTDSVVKSTKKVQDAIEALRFPIPSGKVTISNAMTATGGLPVTDVGGDLQQIIDEATTGTTYIGFGARGLSTSATGWLIQKIVESGTTTTMTHAIDTWANHTGATYS